MILYMQKSKFSHDMAYLVYYMYFILQAPRLSPQLEFIKAVMSIGSKLQQLPTKELRGRHLLTYVNV